MTQAFNPNTNPYVDDLLRLNMIPSTRFTLQERRLSAVMLAGKLYGLENRRRWDGFYFFNVQKKLRVAIDVVFETELPDLLETRRYFDRFEGYRLKTHLILLRVGASGVSELFNDKFGSTTRETILRAVRQPERAAAILEAGSDAIPARPDEAVSREYFGQGPNEPNRSGGRMGGSGEGRGRDGGGGGGGPTGGDGGNSEGSGAGGTRELLNHPVLFSVDHETLAAILDQA